VKKKKREGGFFSARFFFKKSAPRISKISDRVPGPGGPLFSPVKPAPQKRKKNRPFPQPGFFLFSAWANPSRVRPETPAKQTTSINVFFS